jgi:hypothetical protein
MLGYFLGDSLMKMLYSPELSEVLINSKEFE